MNIPKIRAQIFLDAEELNRINSYGEQHSCRNVSQAISEILKEWYRFKVISERLHKEMQKKHDEAVLKAKAIKE